MLCSAMMQTRTSPPQEPDPLPSLPETPLKASWTEPDEIVFIQYIADHKAEAGDGMKFKPSFWTGAAKEMEPHCGSGGPKTVQSCQAKWDRVRMKLPHIYLSADMSFTSSRRHTMSLVPSRRIHLDLSGVTLGASISRSMRSVHGRNMSR